MLSQVHHLTISFSVVPSLPQWLNVSIRRPGQFKSIIFYWKMFVSDMVGHRIKIFNCKITSSSRMRTSSSLVRSSMSPLRSSVSGKMTRYISHYGFLKDSRRSLGAKYSLGDLSCGFLTSLPYFGPVGTGQITPSPLTSVEIWTEFKR